MTVEMNAETEAPSASNLGKLHSLAGKDYFTVPEAAYYACVSVSHWRGRIQREFPPGEFYGKLLYRRSDVQRFIETKIKWPRSKGEETVGNSTRRRTDASGASPLARSLLGRPRFVVSPKNSSST